MGVLVTGVLMLLFGGWLISKLGVAGKVVSFFFGVAAAIGVVMIGLFWIASNIGAA